MTVLTLEIQQASLERFAGVDLSSEELASPPEAVPQLLTDAVSCLPLIQMLSMHRVSVVLATPVNAWTGELLSAGAADEEHGTSEHEEKVEWLHGQPSSNHA